VEKVVIMGGRSFLGGHICRVLLARGYGVALHSSSSPDFKNVNDLLGHPSLETVVCPLGDETRLMQMLEACTYLIYAAIPYPKQSLGRIKEMDHEMHEMESFLELLSKSAIKKSVFVSVCATIGDADGLATEEDKRSEEGVNAGVRYKIRSENLVFKYTQKGLSATVVNPAVFVGEHDYNPSTGEFFRFFLQYPVAACVTHKFNIIAVEDAAHGVVLALEKGRSNQRYLLCGNNITFGDYIERVRALDGKSMPKICLGERTAIILAHMTEFLNLLLRRKKPLVPIMGIDLTRTMQHYSIEKARHELGFEPGDAWPSVEKAYHWYKKNGIL